MFSRPKFLKVRVKAFLGNGNTKLISISNVPSFETVGSIKKIISPVLNVSVLNMIVFKKTNEYDDDLDQSKLSICESDDSIVSAELLVYARSKTDAKIRNLAFRPASANARNKLQRIEINYN